MSIQALLALFGGAQVVLVALVAWLGRLWLERALDRERHARERDLEALRSNQQLAVESQLERLKADLSQQQATISASMATASAAAALSQEERLKAVKAMWLAARCQRNSALGAIAYWDLLGPVRKSLTPKAKAYFDDQLKFQELTGRCKKEDHETEVLRPFLGEDLWSLYYGYRMLVGRASVPVSLALAQDKVPDDFFADKDVDRLLQKVLSPEELAVYSSLRVDRLQWLLSRFEAKIMTAADAVISGRHLAFQSHQQSLELVDLARRLKNEPTDSGEALHRS